jgi:flagellar biosynthesis/type III secretory pathway M-ring protein FliF/YscJ
MTNKTSESSNSLPNPEPGATDLQWPPSWWRWLIFALSGTVEIERQFALQEQRHKQRMIEMREGTEELRKNNEELRKYNEEFAKSNEELKNENKRLAELESKIDGLFSKYNINSPPAIKPEQH